MTQQWTPVDKELPECKGHYRVKLDDGTEMKAYYHPNYGFTRFWQKLPRVVSWRNENVTERRDWKVRESEPPKEQEDK